MTVHHDCGKIPHPAQINGEFSKENIYSGWYIYDTDSDSDGDEYLVKEYYNPISYCPFCGELLPVPSQEEIDADFQREVAAALEYYRQCQVEMRNLKD